MRTNNDAKIHHFYSVLVISLKNPAIVQDFFAIVSFLAENV